MIGRRLSAFALLLSCASAPLQASGYSGFDRDCWDRSELEALKVQRFKTMLLVSMLNCRDIEPAMAADYNRFVRANRDLIVRNQSVVREHFIRTHGLAVGLNAYSRFETTIGNRYSDADYDYRRCAAAADEARMAGYVSEAGLMDLIQSMPDEDRLAICEREPRYARNWAPPQPPIYAERIAEAAPPPPPPPIAVAEVVPPPPPPVAVAKVVPPPPAAMPERAAEPVVVAQNEWPDLAPIEPEGPARAVDPEEVKVAAAAPVPAEAAPVQVASVEVKAPAPVDRVQAVRDAAKALREALAALEEGEGR